MASVLRRTLSPAHRCDPFSPHPPQRPSPLSSSSYSIPAASCSSLSLRRLLPRAFLLLSRPPRKATRPWNASLLRFLLFFACGLLLGFSPLANVGDDVSMTPRDLAFGTGSSSLSAISRDASTVTPVRALETVKRDEIVAVELEVKNDAEELVTPSKLLILVTPTYNRAMQAYYLTRLGQTLKLVPPPLLWIVSEMGSASMETSEVLRESGVMYRHIVSRKNSTDTKDRGVHQRNAALEHIELHKMDGIVYFADDDNIYSLELFEQMRKIRRFGTWPVAMLAQSKSKATLEGPVCGGSDIVGWHTNEKSKRLRRFHVDMSGFAFNSTILWDPKRWHPSASNIIRQLDTVKEGFQETTFIEQLVEDESQMEAMPSGCSKIMNWHLHLDAHGFSYPKGWRLPNNLEVVIPLQELQNLNGFLPR